MAKILLHIIITQLFFWRRRKENWKDIKKGFQKCMCLHLGF